MNAPIYESIVFVFVFVCFAVYQRRSADDALYLPDCRTNIKC